MEVMATTALQAPPKRKQPSLAVAPVQVGIAVTETIVSQDGEVAKSQPFDLSIRQSSFDI